MIRQPEKVNTVLILMLMYYGVDKEQKAINVHQMREKVRVMTYERWKQILQSFIINSSYFIGTSCPYVPINNKHVIIYLLVLSRTFSIPQNASFPKKYISLVFENLLHYRGEARKWFEIGTESKSGSRAGGGGVYYHPLFCNRTALEWKSVFRSTIGNQFLWIYLHSKL